MVTGASAQVLPQRLPVVFLPTARQVCGQVRRETGVIENHFRARTLRPQLKPGDGVEALRPGIDAPCLDNAPVGQQLEVPPHDVARELGEGPAHLAMDFGRAAALKRLELFGVEERLVDSLRTRLKILFLMDCLRRDYRFRSLGGSGCQSAGNATGDEVSPRDGCSQRFPHFVWHYGSESLR